MLTVNIICIGKLKERYWRDACLEYSKRLGAFCRFSITELDGYRISDTPSDADIKACLEAEGKRIESKLSRAAKTVALCIEGKQQTSLELSAFFDETALHGISAVDFIIGGSHGLCDSIKALADVKMSMSKMTFPHQLARVMLSEQIYRAFMISTGGRYHK